MKLVIVDSNKDIKYKYKEYPYPMEYVGEDEDLIIVKNNNIQESIDKSSIKDIYFIPISNKEYAKIK